MGIIKRHGFDLEGGQPILSMEEGQSSFSMEKGVENRSNGPKSLGLKLKLALVVPEYLKVSPNKILDPNSKFLQVWNRMFVVCCCLAVYCDPLFLYAPYIDSQYNCLGMERNVALTVTILRTVVDAFYCIRIAFQFRTAFVEHSPRGFSQGKLVSDPALIAMRYVTGGLFVVDILSVLPVPQIAVLFFYWFHGRSIPEMKTALIFIILVQYSPRLIRIFPLTSEINKTVAIFLKSVLLGAIFYLSLFVLLSHVVGSFWYILAVQRKFLCMEKACKAAPTSCYTQYLFCSTKKIKPFPISWKNTSESFFNKTCSGKNEDDPSRDIVIYGIYKQALQSNIFSERKFFSKFTYCLWWGLQNLSTLGQGLDPSMSPGEILVSISIAVFGFIFFGLLIGHSQTLIQSLTLKIEEMRMRSRYSEQWMQHRAIPEDLRERIRCYDEYRWAQTGGLDENKLLQNLPRHLKRDANRYQYSTYVRRIPFFAKMGERVLDAICERLVKSLYTKKTYIAREGDPVSEFQFIISGRLVSETTDGGRIGFYNADVLNEGDFCGDELLIWSLDPENSSTLPLSTRTVQALTEVEALAIKSNDMKYVANQFRCLRTRQFQDIFRYYSPQWRIWAVRFIQSAWRRYLVRKMIQIHQYHKVEQNYFTATNTSSFTFGAAAYSSRFAVAALRGIHKIHSSMSGREWAPLSKPPELDYSIDYTQ